MKKIKNLIFGLSATLIATGLSSCDFQTIKSNSNNKSTKKIEIELETELNSRNTTEKIEEVIVATTSTPTLYNEIIEKEDNRKLVSLTFDDGPSKYTEELLVLLKEYDIKVTFFVLGYNINKHSNALLQASIDGHEIAIHGDTHTSFTNLTIDETTTEINNTINYIEALGIDAAELVRPPYGSLNTELKENINYPFILWNIDTEDWKTKDKDQIKQQIIDNIGEGAIILMHDTTSAVHKADMEALKEILPELTQEYRFVTISELCEHYNINLENGKSYRKIKNEN